MGAARVLNVDYSCDRLSSDAEGVCPSTLPR